MPQATLIIPCEVQIGEAHMHINNRQQNSKRKECQIQNANSKVEFI
jgi:hypothetical protein